MAIERTEFGSGLRVVTERMPGVRSVSLGFWVLAGSRDEPHAISGSSHFLEHLLFKGTTERSARDIAEAFDAVGGDVNAFRPGPRSMPLRVPLPSGSAEEPVRL